MYKFYHVISDVIKYNQCKTAGVKQMLVSYFYLRKDDKLLNLLINDNEIEVIVDSGLYSYSNSVEITDEEAKKYSEEYISFIEKNEHYSCFKSFFELDFDLIGYDYHEFVKPYQERLLKATDKMILICQKGRTIEDIESLLTRNINTIAVPFASSIERNYFDWRLLIDMIHNAGKRVHLLGCSTVDYLVYADQSDSSSWFMTAAMGEESRLINNRIKTFHYTESEEVEKQYNERAINNAKFYKNEFQDLVNKKQNQTRHEFLRLF